MGQTTHGYGIHNQYRPIWRIPLGVLLNFPDVGYQTDYRDILCNVRGLYTYMRVYYCVLHVYLVSFAVLSVPVLPPRAGFQSDLMPENSTLNAMIAGFHPACNLAAAGASKVS
jgi:hypothetical protein